MVVFVKKNIIVLLFCYSLHIGKDCLRVEASSLSNYGVYSSSSSSFSSGSGGVSSAGTGYYFSTTSSSSSGISQSPHPTAVSVSPTETPSKAPSETPSISTKPTAVPTPLKILELSTSAAGNTNITLSVVNRTKIPTKEPTAVSVSPAETPSKAPSETPSISTKPTAVPTPLKILELSTSAAGNTNITSSVVNRTRIPTKEPTRTTNTTNPTTRRPYTLKPTVHPTEKPSRGATKSPTTREPQTNKPTVHPTKEEPLTSAPTMSPTATPSTTTSVAISSKEKSNAPTPAESCIFSKEKRQRTILKILKSISPSLQYYEQITSTSPQSFAANWIIHFDSSNLCPTNKHDANIVMQRYIIALIYFSLDGSDWVHCKALNDTNIAENNQDICQDETYQRILSGTHECNWYGMKCNSQGFLTRIKLDKNNLFGEIPTELAYLTNLTHIELGNNQISGIIPESLATSLPQLQVLDLHSNNITGSVPNNFGSVTTLRAMLLENNRLTGTMPESVCDQRSRNLQRLSADCNPLINVLDNTVVNRPIQCPCCTQCFPKPSTVASSSTDIVSQFSNISCSGEETYDDSMAPSVYILYLVYKIESVSYLGSNVDVAVENAVAQYLAKSVLSCYWANHTKGQPFQISAYPPDALKDTCIASKETENCVLIHGFMSIQSSPGESFDLSQLKYVVENTLSVDALNLPITLSSSGENMTVRLSYFRSVPRSPSSNGNELTESSTRSNKTFAKNLFLSVVAVVSLLGLLTLLGVSINRRFSSNHQGGTTGDGKGTAELSHDSKNINYYDTVLSPEIQFVDGDVLSVSDLGFSQRSLTGSSVAWAFPNDDPFCKKATFVELEPADFHPKVAPIPLDVANPYEDRLVPDYAIYPLDSIDFNVIHQCPAWCQTDGVTTTDLRSINESEMGDSFRSSDFENTVIV